jgi:hypothetical protein
MSREPTRLVDRHDESSSEAAFMGGVIRAQRRARASEEKMQDLAGRLGPLLDGGRNGSPSSGTPWLGLSLVAVVLVASGGIWLARQSEPGSHPIANVEANVATEPAETERDQAPPAPLVVEAPPAISVDSLPNVQRAPATAAASSAPRCDEVDLVERADMQLRAGAPAAALAALREHELRCPSGILVQERERIAIEALAKLGRDDAARARAQAFEERFPSSPHLRRVRQVLDGLRR